MENLIDAKDLINDDINVNMGTERGQALLGKSIAEFGLGRSILIDKDNRVIAGNKTLEEAIKQGIVKVRVVETEGDVLVAVKRSDIDLDSKEGRELALADNVVAKENIKFDEAALTELKEKFELNREEWGLEREKVRKMTTEERDKYDKDNGLEPTTAVCPMCYTEFPVDEEEQL